MAMPMDEHTSFFAGLSEGIHQKQDTAGFKPLLFDNFSISFGVPSHRHSKAPRLDQRQAR